MQKWIRPTFSVRDAVTAEFLSVPVLVVLAAGMTVPVLYIDIVINGGATIPWLVVDIATAAVVMLALVMVRKRLSRRRVSVGAAVSAYTAIGVLRGALLAYVTSVIGLATPTSPLERVLNVAVLVPFGAVATSLLVSRARWQRAVHAQLEAYRGTLLLAQAELAERLSAAEDELRVRTRAVLDPTIAQLRDELDALAESIGADVAPAIASFQTAVSDVVRPLSHRLVDEPGEATTQGRISESSDAAGWLERVQAAAVVALPVVLAVALAVSLLGVSGPQWRMGRVLAGLGMVLALLVLVPEVAARLGIGPDHAIPTRAIRWAWLLTVAGLAFIVCIAALRDFRIGTLPTAAIAVTLAARLLVIAALSSVLGVGNLEASVALRRAIADLELIDAAMRRQLWLQRRRLSVTLHGTLQSALTATAIALSRPGLTTDDVVRLRASFEAALTDVGRNERARRDVAVVLRDLASLWRETADISNEVADPAMAKLQQDAALADAVAEVLREGISNAIRHGIARHIAIRVFLRGASVMVVEVRDDGVGPDAASSRGLGSAMFDEVALHWSCVRDGEQTVLSVALALRPS